jgi:hypothetical protein
MHAYAGIVLVMTMTPQAGTTINESSRLFARHTLNMTEDEAVVYAAGFSDRWHRFSHKGQAYGALEYAYRAGWDDQANAEDA